MMSGAKTGKGTNAPFFASQYDSGLSFKVNLQLNINYLLEAKQCSTIHLLETHEHSDEMRGKNMIYFKNIHCCYNTLLPYTFA